MMVHVRFIAFPLSAQKEFAEILTSNASTGGIEAYYYRGMRGDDSQPDSMFSYVSPEQRIPRDHPLRAIRALVEEVLADMSREFDRLYATAGGRRF